MEFLYSLYSFTIIANLITVLGPKLHYFNFVPYSTRAKKVHILHGFIASSFRVPKIKPNHKISFDSRCKIKLEVINWKLFFRTWKIFLRDKIKSPLVQRLLKLILNTVNPR